MKLEGHKVRKVTKSDFSKKIRFSQNLGKTVQNGLQIESLIIFSKLSLRIFLTFCVKLDINIVDHLAKTICPEKTGSQDIARKLIANQIVRF